MSRKPIEFRNPIFSPSLLSAVQWLQPGPQPRTLEGLVRMGRTSEAAALADQLIADADRPKDGREGFLYAESYQTEYHIEEIQRIARPDLRRALQHAQTRPEMA